MQCIYRLLYIYELLIDLRLSYNVLLYYLFILSIFQEIEIGYDILKVVLISYLLKKELKICLVTTSYILF